MKFCSNCGAKVGQNGEMVPVSGESAVVPAGNGAQGSEVQRSVESGSYNPSDSSYYVKPDKNRQLAKIQMLKDNKASRAADCWGPGIIVGMASLVIAIFGICNHVTWLSTTASVVALIMGVVCLAKKSRLTLDISKHLKEHHPELQKDYDKSRDKIMDIYRCFVKGKVLSATAKAKNYLYANNGLSSYISENEDKGIELYRRRNVQSKELTNVRNNYKDQLFHIPFDERYKVRNERFSLSGFPCIYLGDNVETCCKEIGDPKNDETPVTAQFKSLDNISFYDLSYLNNKEIELSTMGLKKLLLSVAVHICKNDMNKSDDNKEVAYFMPNYVIPQLITASIAQHDDENRCIRFESTKFPGHSNYVFIPKSPNLNKKGPLYDEDLRNQFEIKLID